MFTLICLSNYRVARVVCLAKVSRNLWEIYNVSSPVNSYELRRGRQLFRKDNYNSFKSFQAKMCERVFIWFYNESSNGPTHTKNKQKNVKIINIIIL